MFKFIKNKFLFIVLISVLTLVVLVVGALSLYQDNSSVFANDGYILETTTKANNLYYFSADTKYKENVDDYRESPTLQLLECQKKHLAEPLKVYDPFITKDIVENQYHNLDEFLNDVDLVVIMVKHDEIKNNADKLKNKIVFDTVKACDFDNIYHL